MDTDSPHKVIKVLRFSGVFMLINHEMNVALDIVTWPNLEPNENGTQVITSAIELRKLRKVFEPDSHTYNPSDQYTFDQAGAALSSLSKVEWARSAMLLEKLGFSVEMRPNRAPLARPNYSSSIFG